MQSRLFIGKKTQCGEIDVEAMAAGKYNEGANRIVQHYTRGGGSGIRRMVLATMMVAGELPVCVLLSSTARQEKKRKRKKFRRAKGGFRSPRDVTVGGGRGGSESRRRCLVVGVVEAGSNTSPNRSTLLEQRYDLLRRAVMR